MATSRNNRIPSTIERYLELPPELSLVLLTGTLGCSPNWLTALFIARALGQKGVSEIDGEGCGVVLVSWLRDLPFWSDELRRTTGLDVPKLSQQGRFAFVNYLQPDANDSIPQTIRNINSVISRISSGGRQTLLVLDAPDLLLATQCTTTQELNNFVMQLRKTANSTVISCSADLPLVVAADQSITKKSLPLEIDTAAFMTQQAHGAQLVMSVHELSSGAAKDVSGTLRITRGGDSEMDSEIGLDVPEMELLYLIQRDGTVKVFGRGEGSI